ncbi:sulfurtransferase TusA family protein [Calderihabitans maritimus]|uniref:SirA family protein n=1 Tax=Calderihabitans maritimus TaxID=1246530 RepID=A0A1Z5HWL3_9FIRM|nr:sulfurtransferase TusA family protein [Calderihabitans maritimus]GAW93747.1 SirA family protein [Calderihabitans maritimus]
MKNFKANAFLDVTNDVCPLTFVKTKLKLEEMAPGEILEVILKAGEPVQNVPRSVKAEGHKIIKLEKLNDDRVRLLIERGDS